MANKIGILTVLIILNLLLVKGDLNAKREAHYNTVKKKIQNGEFIKPVRDMYRSSMAISESWTKEFREFWDLPDDFEMRE